MTRLEGCAAANSKAAASKSNILADKHRRLVSMEAIPRRTNLKFDKSNDPRRKQHDVQPLPKSKQRHFD
jgi:hypothetical protein